MDNSALEYAENFEMKKVIILQIAAAIFFRNMINVQSRNILSENPDKFVSRCDSALRAVSCITLANVTGLEAK